MLSRLLKWSLVASIAALAVGLSVYLRDMKRAYQRVRAKGTAIPSPYGDIQYTEGGSGTDVLVVHGSGGGYDQGEVIAQAVLGDEFHWIAPSRFGYLGSALPQGATWDDQAHAFAHLLDHLGIKDVAVVAMSHGGPSALLFALLHPEKVSSLTLISCGVAASTAADQAEANEKGEMLKEIFRYDFLYWAIARLFRRQLMGLMGAKQAVMASLPPEQRRTAELAIDYMNPASLRSAGAAFDNEATLPGDRIRDIKAPTLILHAQDDTLQLYHNALFAASTIPDAKLVCFERGGHLLIAVEQSTIRTSLREHILNHLRQAPAQLS
ncbi:MAG TPA: alpha/beta hydrolase [Anaerolineae bacterium]|nr:alpha/beta hydrolase [Anaerolineae bacterium]